MRKAGLWAVGSSPCRGGAAGGPGADGPRRKPTNPTYPVVIRTAPPLGEGFGADGPCKPTQPTHPVCPRRRASPPSPAYDVLGQAAADAQLYEPDDLPDVDHAPPVPEPDHGGALALNEIPVSSEDNYRYFIMFLIILDCYSCRCWT